MAAVSGKRRFLTELGLRQIHRLAAVVVQIGFIVFEHALAEIQNSIGGDLFQQNGGIVPRFFRKYPFSAFKHCHAYSIIIVVFLQEIIR